MRKYTSAARMPLWKWILCAFGGIIIFTLLQGLSLSIPRLGGFPWQALARIFAAILILFLYAVWVNLTERRPVTELPMSRMVPDSFRGLGIGLGYFLAVVGIMAAVGVYRIAGAQFHLVPQLEGIALFLLVGVCEEVIFRGILFRMIDDRWNTFVALIVSALVFGGAHLLNPGADWWSSLAIAIEAGLLLGAAYKFSGNLWLPIGIHWIWNYLEGYVLGFPVSGTVVDDKIFNPVITGPELVTGGIFGAEGSIIAVGVGLVVSILLLLRAPEDRRR